jgi:hypothetical protein
MRTQSVDANGAGGFDRSDVPGLLVAIVGAELAGVLPATLIASEVAFATYLNAGFWYLN